MTAAAPTSSHPVRINRTIVWAGLLGGAATASGIALTATSGWLIVRASERPVILTLLAAIVAVRAFGMARPYFRYLERLVSHDSALADLAERRAATYAALIPLTPARLGRRARSQVLTAVVDDLTDTVEAQVRVTVPIISSLVAGVLATVLTALVEPVAGLILAGLLLVIALACLVAHRLESHSQAALLEARAEVQRVSDLVARQADELRAIGAGATALGWVENAHALLASATRRQSRGRALVASVILLGTGAATALTAYLVDPGTIGGPLAALLVVLPVAVGDALAPLPEAMRALARAEGSQQRLDALLDQTPAVTVPAEGAAVAAGQPSLATASVTASWTGAREDLAATDLDLPPGRRVAVIGANGSGKSTLLAVLARHLDPTGGRYAVDDADVRGLDLDQVRSRLAVVDDEPHVFAGSLRANLALAAPDATDDDQRRALDRAGLAPWVDGLPEGLDTLLGTGGRGLSGGERARLGVARAIVSERPAVLLDEPVAHLDHATATAVIEDLVRASAGRTVVMVSHRPDGVEAFDAVLDLTPSRTSPVSLTDPKE